MFNVVHFNDYSLSVAIRLLECVKAGFDAIDMYFHMIFLIYLVNNIKPTDLWALFLYRLEDSPTLCLRFGESGAHEGALSEQVSEGFL